LIVYIIALSGALSAAEKTWLPALFSIAALLSGEVVWRLILLRKPNLQTS